MVVYDSLGAHMQTNIYSDLYASLKQGVVVWEENPVFTILAASLYEIQNELAMTNHYFDCQVLLIDKTIYESLFSELHQIIKEEAVKARDITRARISKGEASVVNELKSRGMHITYLDRQSFIVKMNPAYEKVGELSGKEKMTRLLKAVADNKTAH